MWSRTRVCVNGAQHVRRHAARSGQRTFTSTDLISYTGTPPTEKQLEKSSQYFARGPVSFLFSASKLPNFPAQSKIPEIVFLGRSNVGKSSLLNALLNKKNAKIARESKTPGHTKTMNVYGVGGAVAGAGTKRQVKAGMSIEMLRKAGAETLKKNMESRNTIGSGVGLAVVDCPGYGYGSQTAWGEVVMRYLEKREQLARAYLLVDPSIPLQKDDMKVIEILQKAEAPFQIVLSKVDKILFPLGRPDLDGLDSRLQALRQLQVRARDRFSQSGKVLNMVPDILCTSSNDNALGQYRRIGIQELQFAVLEAVGLTRDGKGIDAQQADDEDPFENVVSWDQLESLNGSATKRSAAGT